MDGVSTAAMTGSTPAPARANAKRRMPRLIVRLHRWISLACALFWLIQAVTGMLIVFHWELEDAAVSGAHQATDLSSIDARLDALAPPGSGRRVISVWTTAGAPDRYDVKLENADGSQRSVRIAGDGTVLRDQDAASRGLPGTLVAIHQTLLAGEAGEWIVGLSGLLLLGNLTLALVVAWPKRGHWRRSLFPSRRGPLVANYYAWHRAVGLWAVLPSLCLVAAGTMLRFEDGVAQLVGAHALAPPPPVVTGKTPLSFARTVANAEAALPGSRLTAVTMPTATDETYRIRLLSPGEPRRAYGTSVVFIDGASGRVRAIAPAASATPGKAFVDGLYAIHTGEFGGIVGRWLVLALGVWLSSMTLLGLLLWNRRRVRR